MDICEKERERGHYRLIDKEKNKKTNYFHHSQKIDRYILHVISLCTIFPTNLFFGLIFRMVHHLFW